MLEVVSIICGDTKADNEESNCCSEYLISEEVISVSASKRPTKEPSSGPGLKLDQAVPTLSKSTLSSGDSSLFTLHSVNILCLVRDDCDSSLEQLICEKTSHTTSSFWKKGSLS